MSSLSFENLFQPESAKRAEGVLNAAADARIARLAPAWSDPFPVALPAEAATAQASPWALSATRRMVDCVIATAALIAFLPVMIGAALLVRFGSWGPVLFRQRRMGRHGREFTLYKFRSMTPQKGSNSCITVSGDTRVTPVGAFLRRYKLDELPQFWNVLRGDMSLVGPRPKLPHHEALHMPCRPGITGAATLAFRNEEEFLSEVPEDQLDIFYESFVKPAKAQLDLQYMQTASFASDLRLIWQTATSCFLSCESAQGQSAETIARYQLSRKLAAKTAVVSASHAVPAPRAHSLSLNSEL